MKTHRYVRPLPSVNRAQKTDDIYNLQISRPRITPASSKNDIFEYWTNGTTTLLATIEDNPRNMNNKNIPNPVPNPRVAHFGTSATAALKPSGAGGGSSKVMPKRSPSIHHTGSKSSANGVFRNSLLAGSMAGVCSALFWCRPFEMVRTKMKQPSLSKAVGPQVFVAPHHRMSSAGVMTLAGNMPPYSNMLPNSLYRIGRGESPRSLYHYTTGLSLPAVAAQAIYKGTVFAVNNLTLHALVDWNTRENYKLGNFQSYQLTLADRFTCGFLAGAVNGALFVTPVEYVRHELQSQQQQQRHQRPVCTLRKGLLTIVRNTLQSNGATGFWRGLAPTVLRDSIGWGCFFTVLAISQQHLSASLTAPSSHQGMTLLDLEASSLSSPLQNSPSSKPATVTTTSVVMISGSLAGLAFWVWALPLGTIKTWIHNGTAQSVQHALELSRKRGLRQTVPSLFGGWQVAYGRGAPAAAIYVTVYTLAYNYFAGDHHQAV